MNEKVTLDDYKDEEERESMFGALPQDWQANSLDNSILFSNTSSGLESFPGEKTYIPTAGVKEGKIVGNDGKITYEDRPSRANLEIESGDILFAKMADSVKVLKGVKGENDEYVFSTGFIRTSTSSDVNAEYLKQVFLSERFNKKKDSIAIGSTQPAINLSDLSGLVVPVPPLQEQRKVASVLYTVDRVIEKTEKIINTSREVTTEIAQDIAISGIGHSEFEEVRLGPKKARVPVDWDVSTFGELSDVQQGLQIAKSKRYRENAENRFQYITVEYLNDPQDPSNNWYIEEPRETVICDEEDILMTRTGNTGEVITGVEGAFHNNFFKIQFDRDLLIRDYLVHYLESKVVQDVLISYAGTTTIPDLNHGEFFNIPVLIPPISEQKKISQIIGSMNEKIELEEKYLSHLNRLKRGLTQDLLSGTVRTTDTNIEVPEEVAQHG